MPDRGLQIGAGQRTRHRAPSLAPSIRSFLNCSAATLRLFLTVQTPETRLNLLSYRSFELEHSTGEADMKCLRCGGPRVLSDTSPTADDFAIRSFECPQCGDVLRSISERGDKLQLGLAQYKSPVYCPDCNEPLVRMWSGTGSSREPFGSFDYCPRCDATMIRLVIRLNGKVIDQ
jgi:Zn finger protein HypA/HybF involved in hydrogenase expression